MISNDENAFENVNSFIPQYISLDSKGVTLSSKLYTVTIFLKFLVKEMAAHFKRWFVTISDWRGRFAWQYMCYNYNKIYAFPFASYLLGLGVSQYLVHFN